MIGSTGNGEDSQFYTNNEEDEDEYLFNEYSIDDTLDSLTRLERYHGSDFSLQRMVLVRDILDTAKEAGHDATLSRLLPLLPAFVNDSEPAVRQALAEQMYGLAEFTCTGGDGGESTEGYSEVLNSFLPYLIELLSDKNAEVGSTAVSALLKVCNLVHPEHFEAHVLTVVKQLAEDARAEAYRVVAAELCNELAPLLGKELCMNKIVPIVQTLADDTGFSVRKTVAAHLGTLSKTIGPANAVEFIFPLYKTLATDMIWGVRKACAESIADISEALTGEVREGPLAQIFDKFLEDISRWVRVAASNNLGRYLYTFGPGACPPSLVKLFTRLAYDTETGADTDYPEYCAFNFPAVAQTIGKERWDELEDAFMSLVKDMQWKVRRTLSHSLHEIAKIVGREITEKILSQAFDIFILDLDEVRVGCLQHVAEFLEVMGPEKREQYVPKMCVMKDQADSWRLRTLIGSTFGDLSHLVSPEFTSEHIVPVCIRLMDDSVSGVRQAMYKSSAKVLQRLCEGKESDKNSLLHHILANAEARPYQKRQMLPYIAVEVCKTGNYKLFEEAFLAPLLQLANDDVANVRLIVAKCAADILEEETLKEHDSLLKALEQLKQDQDRDVAYFSGNTEAQRKPDHMRIESERIRLQEQQDAQLALPEALVRRAEDEEDESAAPSQEGAAVDTEGEVVPAEDVAEVAEVVEVVPEETTPEQDTAPPAEAEDDAEEVQKVEEDANAEPTEPQTETPEEEPPVEASAPQNTEDDASSEEEAAQ